MDLAKNANRTGPRTCCSRLRWKGMFVDVEPDPSVPNPRDGFCWCSLTHDLPGSRRPGGRRGALRRTDGAASSRCEREEMMRPRKIFPWLAAALLGRR